MALTAGYICIHQHCYLFIENVQPPFCGGRMTNLFMTTLAARHTFVNLELFPIMLYMCVCEPGEKKKLPTSGADVT